MKTKNLSLGQYMGGKYFYRNWILQHLPKKNFSCFTEVFGGMAHVLFALPERLCRVEVYNDKWDDLVNMFEQLRDNSKALIKELKLYPYSRSVFNDFAKKFKTRDFRDDLERAVVVLYLNKSSFNGKFGQYFRTSNTRDMAMTLKNKISQLDSLSERVRDVVIEKLDFREVIKKYDGPNTIFYCMPEKEKILLNNFKIKELNQLTEGEKLASGTTIQKVFRRQTKNEDIYKIKFIGGGNLFPIKTSSSHKFLIKRDDKYEYISSSELRIKDFLVINTNNEIKNFLPPYNNIIIKKGRRKNTKFTSDYKKFCELLGYFAAEGHYVNKRDGIGFSFHTKEVQFHNDVKKLMKDIFSVDKCTETHNQSPNCLQLLFSSRDVYNYMKDIVIKKPTLRFADWVMKLDPKYQINILYTWLNGDGQINFDDSIQKNTKFTRTGIRNRWKILGTTISYELAMQMYHIALRCKLHPCLKYRKNKKSTNLIYDVYFTTLYDVKRLLNIDDLEGRICKRRKWEGDNLLTPITKIDKIKYTGTMIDISCDSPNIYYMSTGVHTHNCDPPYINTEHYYTPNFTEDDHIDLSKLLNSIEGYAMLSYYELPILDKLYPTDVWDRQYKEGVKHATNYKDGKKRDRSVELLLLNYKSKREYKRTKLNKLL